MIIAFCGHRSIPDTETVYKKLKDELTNIFNNAEKHHLKLTFYCGGYGNFDFLAARTVNKLKDSFPDIACLNIFVTPYITENYKYKNEQMRKIFDDIIYPPIESVPYRYAIPRRNEWIATNADLLIAYVIYSWGVAAKMLEYAKKRGKQIIMI